MPNTIIYKSCRGVSKKKLCSQIIFPKSHFTALCSQLKKWKKSLRKVFYKFENGHFKNVQNEIFKKVSQEKIYCIKSLPIFVYKIHTIYAVITKINKITVIICYDKIPYQNSIKAYLVIKIIIIEI